MEREAAAAREVGSHGGGIGALAGVSRWGFLLCATVAVSYGLWALYGSGARTFDLDVTRELEHEGAAQPSRSVGPLPLAPGMNPMRAVLHASHAPVGSTRMQYEISLEDASGRRLWEAEGFFGSQQDNASVVMTRTSLATFDVAHPGDHYVRLRTTGSTMDDLREARIELRRQVLVVDARIPWGFGLAAAAFLLTSLAASRFRLRTARAVDESPRRAA